MDRSKGRSQKQIERHIVRDTLTLIRKDWKVEKKILADARREEIAGQIKGGGDRAVREKLKAKLSLEKQEYYAQQAVKGKAERAAVKAQRVLYWEKKEAVLTEARQEMIKALVEDEGLWDDHPRELMNRRYVTHNGEHYLKAHN